MDLKIGIKKAKKMVQKNDERTVLQHDFLTIEEELEYLRVENNYLKKLRGLIQAHQQKIK